MRYSKPGSPVRARRAATAALLVLAGCGGMRASPPLRTATVGEALARAEAGATTAGAIYRLAIPPFAVDTPDPALVPFAWALADLLADDLAGATRLTLVDRDRTGQLLAARAATPLDSISIPFVAERLAARQVVLGRLAQLPDGAGVRLTLRIADVERGLLHEPIAFQAPRSALPDLVGSLAARVRAALGVVPPGHHADAAAHRPPTRDLEALRDYGEGLRAEAGGDVQGARLAFRQAARLDPTFRAAVAAAERARVRAESGTARPLGVPGLRARDAAVGLAIDHVNRPLQPITGVMRHAGGAGDPAFPGATATIEIVITRP